MTKPNNEPKRFDPKNKKIKQQNKRVVQWIKYQSYRGPKK